MADKIAGFLEVGRNEQGEIVINHPDLKPDENGVGHIVFSKAQARGLAYLLLKNTGSTRIKESHELDYFEALQRIAEYHDPEWFEKRAEKTYGLSPPEALAMAYENVLFQAREAIRGRRRPLKGAF